YRCLVATRAWGSNPLARSGHHARPSENLEKNREIQEAQTCRGRSLRRPGDCQKRAPLRGIDALGDPGSRRDQPFISLRISSSYEAMVVTGNFGFMKTTL